jgi:hypothetical protein
MLTSFDHPSFVYRIGSNRISHHTNAVINLPFNMSRAALLEVERITLSRDANNESIQY